MECSWLNPESAGWHARDSVQTKPAQAIPDDLRVWLGEPALVRVVIEAAAEVGTPSDTAASAAGALPVRLPHAQSLSLLAYAYLTRRYGSDEIVEESESDPALRYLGGGARLESARLRTYRRRHRGPLSVVMLRVLLQGIAQRRAAGWLGFGLANAPAAAADLELTRRCAEFAEVLIGRAVMADTAALDV
jgi:hypothetical protein